MCTVCKKFAHDTLCAHFFRKVALCAHFSGSPKNFCANFFLAAGNFMHTFSGQDRTSCTLFKAVFRNLCVLALHPVHTVRPPTGCPVPPRAPSARPAWIKLCGLCCIYSWHQGQRRRPRRAAATRLQVGAEQNNAAASKAALAPKKTASEAKRRPRPFQPGTERSLLSRR